MGKGATLYMDKINFSGIKGKNDKIIQKNSPIKGKETPDLKLDKDGKNSKDGKDAKNNQIKGKETNAKATLGNDLKLSKDGKDTKDKPLDPTSIKKTFQQVQEEKKKERETEELLRTQIEQEVGFSMGPSCENRICAACEIIVEEFGIIFILFIHYLI